MSSQPNTPSSSSPRPSASSSKSKVTIPGISSPLSAAAIAALTPLRRGRGRPPKNRDLIALREKERAEAVQKALDLGITPDQIEQLQRQQAQQLRERSHRASTPSSQRPPQHTPQRVSKLAPQAPSPRMRPPSTPYRNGTAPSSPYQPQQQSPYMHPGTVASPDHGMMYAPLHQGTYFPMQPMPHMPPQPPSQPMHQQPQQPPMNVPPQHLPQQPQQQQQQQPVYPHHLQMAQQQQQQYPAPQQMPPRPPQQQQQPQYPGPPQQPLQQSQQNIPYPPAQQLQLPPNFQMPTFPSYRQQQEEQQKRNQAQVQKQQQQKKDQQQRTAASSVSGRTSDAGGPLQAPDGTIMTAAGGSIGAGLGQAVGNAGASPASRTRRRTESSASEPELLVPDQGDLGWMPEGADPEAAHDAYAAIVDKVRNHTDKSGRRISEPLQDCPDEEEDPDYYEKVEKPTSLTAIEQRIKNRDYPSAMAFEMDMLQLFENGRRGFQIGSVEYGDVVTLQRLYHHLTKARPSWTATGRHITAADVEDAARDADAEHHFASRPHGPGFASLGSDGDLTTRISGKMKTYYEHLNFKGRAYRVGDWIHLMNPSDPSKPIVAQIFKVARRDDNPDQGYITVCWYFRPEQTHHAASKRFYRDEVVKTGYFADHQVEDVLEKVLVMFYTKFIRGRPKPEYWDPRSPIYITESRYNEQQQVFHKIKSWASCVPEEIRKVETPMDYFDKSISAPPREDSPFLRGIAGPGAIRDEDPAGIDGHDFPDLFKDSIDEGALRARKRVKKADGEAVAVSSSGGSAAAATASQSPLDVVDTSHMTPFELFNHLAAAVASRVSAQDYAKIQKMLSSPQAASLDLARESHLLGGVDPNLLADLRSAAFAVGMALANQGSRGGDGALDTGLQGGIDLAALVAAQKGEGFFAELPEETRKLFADTPDGQVTWTPAPPVDGAPQQAVRRAGFYDPREVLSSPFSLDYLYDQVSRGDVDSDAAGGGSSGNAAGKANGHSTPRALLHRNGVHYPSYAAEPSDSLGATTSAAAAAAAPRSSPSALSTVAALASDTGMPSLQPSPATQQQQQQAQQSGSLTPFMSQSGWMSDWGEDQQKTAEALADFVGQYDATQLNLGSYGGFYGAE